VRPAALPLELSQPCGAIRAFARVAFMPKTRSPLAGTPASRPRESRSRAMSTQSHEHIEEGIMHTRGHHLGSKLAFLPGLTRRMTVFALLMLLVPTIGSAQTPAREGNTWGWRHHQPTRAGIQRREHTSGIAPSPSQRKALDQQVERLDRRLLDKEPSAAVPQGQR